MCRIVLFTLFFNLIFLISCFSSDDGHIEEDLSSEAEDSVSLDMQRPPTVRRKSMVQSLPYTTTIDHSSAASASPPIDLNTLSCTVPPPTPITEEEKEFLAKKNRYKQLVKKIKNRTVADDEIFRDLKVEFDAGTNLDTFHQIFKRESLVEILMIVTRPRDWVYEAGGIIKDSNNDNFRHCFRDLGNELYWVDLHEEYKNMTITFKGSRLEKRLINPNIVDESCGGCCAVQ